MIELRLAGIITIEDANKFLKSYLKEFNDMFSLPIHHTKSVFEKQPSNSKIDQILAVLSTRKIDSGHCIRYKNKFFIPVTRSGKKAYLKKGMTAMVIESFTGNFYANILDELFALEEIPERETYSKNFDTTPVETKIKKQYIPPMSHPRKHASYLAYVVKKSTVNLVLIFNFF